MNLTFLRAGVIIFALAANSIRAQTTAQAAGEFSLQGRLTTTAGSPVIDGQHTLVIKVYEQGTANVVYSETDVVTTMNGVFSTMVGDNGDGGADLMVDAMTDYELGVAVNGESEMMPHIRIGDAMRAAVAANAGAVAGFRVDTSGVQVHSLVTTDASGRLRSSLLGSNLVTSVQGLRGDVNFEVTGSGVTFDTTGGVLRLNINGGGGGGLSFPYSQNLNQASGTGFSLSNAQGGTTGAFINTGSGLAFRAQSASGTAIRAMSNGTGSAAATIQAENTNGIAMNLIGHAASDATLRIQNNAADSTAMLISAVDASGDAMFEVAADGRTMISSTAGNALDVSTSAAGETALKVTGGLMLDGPAGTATIDLSNGQVTVDNANARANSIIMLTITSATGLSAAAPIRVSSQSDGSFTVSAISTGLGSLTGSYSFNYLIINRPE